MKKIIMLMMVIGLGLTSCNKDNPQPNENNVNYDDCNCGIVISREYDVAQGRYKTKVMNECSKTIKTFTLIPDNGDDVPEVGVYWCKDNGSTW